MRGVRGCGESAGADEEGPHEVGGGRLPDDLPAASTARCRADDVQGLLHEVVCNGCILAAGKRGMDDCAFCRAPMPKESQTVSMIQKRVNAGDPMAMWYLGKDYADGDYGLAKDVARAVELYERAADLGVKKAHFTLGYLYDEGKDVEKDTAKAIRHYEAAAIKGGVLARHNLGIIEYNARNYDLALQHFLISAKLGDQDSLDEVKEMFTNGLATRADYADALREYQHAVEEMSSPDRDEAKE